MQDPTIKIRAIWNGRDEPSPVERICGLLTALANVDRRLSRWAHLPNRLADKTPFFFPAHSEKSVESAIEHTPGSAGFTLSGWNGEPGSAASQFTARLGLPEVPGGGENRFEISVITNGEDAIGSYESIRQVVTAIVEHLDPDYMDVVTNEFLTILAQKNQTAFCPAGGWMSYSKTPITPPSEEIQINGLGSGFLAIAKRGRFSSDNHTDLSRAMTLSAAFRSTRDRFDREIDELYAAGRNART